MEFKTGQILKLNRQKNHGIVYENKGLKLHIQPTERKAEAHMKIMNLGGAWKMRQCGTENWHDALVPGSVYADLMRDGSMPDPFWRDNELAAFELLKNDFEYRRTFTVDSLESNRIVLRCHGLDTLAHVILNGAEIAYAENMHITWMWDVKALLKEGENELVIRFDSPIHPALERYDLSPGWCSSDAIPGFQHVRKAHCMYGWDWGPRLPDAGIWRDIELLFIDEARLESVLVWQDHEDGKVTLRFEPEIDGRADAVQVTVTAPDGETFVSDGGSITIENPQLWWPSGYGEQPLYTVRVTISTAGAQQDVWERRIGLRTLSISRQKDQWGEEFCHIVNGVKVFAMGADYIPEDNILLRVTPERTRRLLQDAKLAHFNSVRVWGGGYYPDDFFFDICDELGLMVWQDLMFSCAFYDMTPEFDLSIRMETEQNVKRMRHHASLALICGNNEMEMFMGQALQTTMQGDLYTNGPKDYHHYADYVKMFEYVLPSVVKTHAPQTFWWPASPSCGGNFDNPNDPNRGDVHYWEVWHGKKPFTDYRNFFFRYASEFGFQSFPCLKTVESFTEPEDRNVFSRIMEYHQRNKAANGNILAYLAQTYQYPYSFDNLLYYSQLLQADAIRYGVEHWRRNRGRCMGAIIWQLNDCWPVASWASIDYFGRWKAMHYAAKRFFAPVMISCEEEGELTLQPNVIDFIREPFVCRAKLNVTNETLQDVSGTVKWELRTPDGSVVSQGSKEITVPALSAVWLDEESFPEAKTTTHYLHFAFVCGGETVSEGCVLFCAPKHFGFKDAKLSVKGEGDEIVVSSEAFARFVYIESDDPDMLLSDNFFDMNPGEKRVKVLRGSADNLRVRCVYDAVK